MSCETCAFANTHGWFGPEHSNAKATHCRSCHRSWTGAREVHCVGCCLNFTSHEVLALHKTSGNQCRPPLECVTEDGEPLLEGRPSYGGVTFFRFGAAEPFAGWPESTPNPRETAVPVPA